MTEEETINLDKAERYLENKKAKKMGLTVKMLSKYHDMRPEASYYFKSLFPNNFLSTKTLKDKKELSRIGSEFKILLDTNPSERQILNFINQNKYYNLIASIFHSGLCFGHHGAYLFKEFELPSTFKSDYLLVGKNSHGYHFAFVELENPSGSITTKDGGFGTTIRKGIKQIEDWDKWLEGNFNSLSLIFDKYKSDLIELPKEFRSLNKTRLNYVIVSGRREDFNDNTYEEKRRLLRNQNINLLHYDNLLDSFELFQTTYNY
ncbi:MULTISPECIES: Shedu anti-phage system protein SduA domain-containing protein [Flavobacterium]|uniref:Shedu anti-phage system protein SduA domain-containing protein n=1 Tax=Flavobacterium TaxID=237 RepID=UPI00164258B2|nr:MULTISPECIES: Shedu anti-phage system protein SduA domain-containing protein [Flavobacterium]MCR4029496.1 DUF4263 domain-containing protein [Flavobacterium panacis]